MRRFRPLGQVKLDRRPSQPLQSPWRYAPEDELLAIPRLALRRRVSEPTRSMVLEGKQMASAAPSRDSPASTARSEAPSAAALHPASPARSEAPPAASPARSEVSPGVALHPASPARSVVSPTAALDPETSDSAVQVQSEELPRSPRLQTLRGERLRVEDAVRRMGTDNGTLEEAGKSASAAADEYRRLYEAEVTARQRTEEARRSTITRLDELREKQQRLRSEHELSVASLAREHALKMEVDRRGFANEALAVDKKLHTLGACVPGKETAVNERQSQLALLQKDKEQLLDEIERLRLRVGKIDLELGGDTGRDLCRDCDAKAANVKDLREQSLRLEDRIRDLQDQIRAKENAKPKKFYRRRSAKIIGERRAV